MLHKNAVLLKEIHHALLSGVLHMETVISLTLFYYILFFFISLPYRI